MLSLKESRFSLQDTKFRSFIKTILWRVVGAILTFIVTFTITRNSPVSIMVTLFREITSTTLYYFYERLWNKISWGKYKNPD